jgi:Ca2+:H+ antiporter
LALAAISLTVPATFHLVSPNAGHQNEIWLALVISIVQITVYFLSLIFSLKTHRQLYNSPVGAEGEDATGTTGWGVKKSVIILLLATVMVAVLSEYLVQAVEEAAKLLGITQMFIGIVLVAIVGNAAEHSTAVLMAMKNKMDLSINIALGSGSQIALFVAPVIVFASFAIGKPMNLCFSSLEILSIVVSVIILSFVATDGECNWLEGVQLLAVYAILAAAFFFA